MSTTSPEDYTPPPLKRVIQAIRQGIFGEKDLLLKLLSTILNNNDWYLLTADFQSYIEAQQDVDRAYLNQEEWTKRSIRNAIRSSKFSSDRTINEYASQIWGIKPQKVFEEHELTK